MSSRRPLTGPTRRLLSTGVAGLVCAGLTVGALHVPAQAVPTLPGGPNTKIRDAAAAYRPGDAGSAAALADAASPRPAVPLTATPTGASADLGDLTVDIHRTGTATLADASTSVGISPVDAGTSGTLADGALVSSGDAGASELVVRATAAGAQLVSLLPDAAHASTSFTVDVPEGGRVETSDTGAVEVIAPTTTTEVTEAGAEQLDAQISAIIGEDPVEDLTPEQIARIDALPAPATETTTADAVVASVEAPWAYDARGVAVPTHFVVEGTTVTQVVDATSDTRFPVTADPSVLWWTKHIIVCGAEVAAILVPGKLAAAGAKLAKAALKSAKVREVRTLIKEGGGLAKTIRDIKKYATSKGKALSATGRARVKAIVSRGGAIIADILGLGGCWDIVKELS